MLPFKKKSKINKAILELDQFLKKHKLPNSIRTSSELLGFFASIECSPDFIEPTSWFYRIWNHVDEDIEFGESIEEIIEFEESCNFFLDDCETKLYDRTYQNYFQGDYDINLSEWCQGFLRGRVFWEPYFGPIFEDLHDNKNSNSNINCDFTDSPIANPTINKNEVVIQKADFVEASPEIEDDFEEIVSKDKSYHQSKEDDETDEEIRVNALTFIGLVSSLGAPELKSIDFGVYLVIDEKAHEKIPLLIYSFQEYLLGISYDFIPAYDSELALEDLIKEQSLNEFDENEMATFYTNIDSNGQPTSNLNQITKPDRNDPCPCGSGKKYKKCCSKM